MHEGLDDGKLGADVRYWLRFALLESVATALCVCAALAGASRGSMLTAAAFGLLAAVFLLFAFNSVGWVLDITDHMQQLVLHRKPGCCARKSEDAL